MQLQTPPTISPGHRVHPKEKDASQFTFSSKKKSIELEKLNIFRNEFLFRMQYIKKADC